MSLVFSQNTCPMLGIPPPPLSLIGGACVRYIVRTEVNNWYPSLKNPSQHPPKVAFAFAWTSLYVGLG